MHMPRHPGRRYQIGLGAKLGGAGCRWLWGKSYDKVGTGLLLKTGSRSQRWIFMITIRSLRLWSVFFDDFRRAGTNFRWRQFVLFSHAAFRTLARLFQTFEPGQFPVSIILTLQARVSDEELVVDAWIFVAKRDAAFKNWQGFIVTSQTYEQSPQIVMSGIVIRLQRNRAT